MLTDLLYYERAAVEGRLPEVIRELERAAGARSSEAKLAQTFTLLARALRRDFAFLVQHPEEVLARLYAGCRFHDSAEELAVRATAPGASVPPLAPRRSLVGDLFDRWAAERRRSGRPWLRSLQPGADAIMGPLREVYRGDGGRVPGRVRFDEQKITLTVFRRRLEPSVSEPRVSIERQVVGWERASGKAFEGSTFVEPLKKSGGFSSPDGRVWIEAEGWNGCRLLDAETRAEIAALPLEDGRIWDAFFFADGRRVALAGDENEGDGLVMVFDLVSRSVVQRLTGGSTIYHVTGTPDGRLLATAAAESVVLWEWASPRRVSVIPTKARNIALSGDARELLTENDGEVRIWEIEGGTEPGSPPLARGPWLTNAAFSPDGNALLLGAWLCDGRTGAPRAQLAHWYGSYLEGGPARDALRITDERIALLAEGVAVWSTRDGTCLIPEQLHRVRHVHWDLIAISADARRFARTRRCERERDGIAQKDVIIRDVDTTRELARFAIHGAGCLAFSPDGARLVAGSDDGVVRVWDAQSGRLLASFDGHRHPVSGVAFLADGVLAVSGAEDDAVCVWDSRSGAELIRRALDEDAPSYTFWSKKEGSGTRRYWTATPHAVAEVEIAAGLRPRLHPWRARRAGATLQIVHADTGQIAGTLPSNGPIVPHPQLPIWAGAGLHIVLEPLTDTGA